MPSERNAKGFVTDNPTIWDRASELLYAEAKAAKDAGDDDTYEKIRKQAYLLKGKPKYLVAFVNLADGQYGVVDLTPKQASGVFATIQKYAKRLDKLAFELSKTGSSTNTTVSLTPILDMDEELTEQERKNFEAADALEPFDFALFETCLYVADEAEQTKNLEIAGFDIRRLGLSSEAAATAADGAVTPLPKNDGNKPEIIF
ncbi:hypothetical protein [Paenibacillus cisolokensis]|uniref:hypothetical protein n=1 Tax=Paenibacillus cisolokensis TaxID=1658519 RepID=UPI001FD12727|nr:hypothetical protein [Paenibacillus cisolokensis]